MAASIGAFSYLRNTSLIFVILISFRCIIKNIVTKFCLLGDGHGLFLNCLWSAFCWRCPFSLESMDPCGLIGYTSKSFDLIIS